MKPRICIVTAGHLSTCPRMLKAADALHEAGYDVRVVSARFMDWAWDADCEIHRTRGWSWSPVSYDRRSAPLAYLRSGVRFKITRRLCRTAGSESIPAGVASRAFSRPYFELLQAAMAAPADLFYGGNSAGIAVAAVAAQRRRVPFGLDLEDFYSEMLADGEDDFESRLAERVERAVLSKAAFLTAGSAPIAAAYAEKYDVQAVPINNTFPLPAIPPNLTPSDGPGLKLYWFSQTIGPGRGLEDVIRAMGLAELPGELHLRGNASGDYVDGLRRLSAETAPALRIVVHPPASPEQMIELSRSYDVGLATEPGFSLNNGIALSNKAFTYVLAGLAVVFTDTAGQRPLAHDLDEGAILYSPGDAETLAAKLRVWANDKPSLARAKSAAWEAARRRWHWEHPQERGALLGLVATTLGGGPSGDYAVERDAALSGSEERIMPAVSAAGDLR